MIFLISPAKSLNESLVTDDLAVTSPRFGKDTDGLIKVMQKKKPKEIVDLMGVSKGLADLNYQRYQDFTNQTEKPCVLMFDGDVYRGLQAETLDSEGLKFAQDHLRIASGLYGLLRPLDQIRPYRLEMGLPLKTTRGTTLYDFWGTRLARQIESDAKDVATDKLINLASHEYSRAVAIKSLKLKILSIKFLDLKDNQARVLSFFAKAARGQMARYIIDQRLDRIEGLKDFNHSDYRFDSTGSQGNEWVFVRPQPALKSAKSASKKVALETI